MKREKEKRKDGGGKKKKEDKNVFQPVSVLIPSDFCTVYKLKLTIPIVFPIAPRRLDNRHIEHQRACWWLTASALHADKSRRAIAHTILRLLAGTVQY